MAAKEETNTQAQVLDAEMPLVEEEKKEECVAEPFAAAQEENK